MPKKKADFRVLGSSLLSLTPVWAALFLLIFAFLVLICNKWQKYVKFYIAVYQ